MLGIKKKPVVKTVRGVYAATVADLEEIKTREDEAAQVLERQIAEMKDNLVEAQQESGMATAAINNFKELFGMGAPMEESPGDDSVES